MKNVRPQLTFLCILCALLFSGWIFATVEIRTENGEPLINLDELLFSTQIGQPGSEDEGSLVQPPEEEEKSEGVTGQEKPVKVKQIKIVVCNKEVTCLGKSYSYDRKTGEIEGFAEVLGELAGAQIVLQDSYAEAHAYRYVLEKIRSVVTDDAQIIRTMLGGQEVRTNEN